MARPSPAGLDGLQCRADERLGDQRIDSMKPIRSDRMSADLILRSRAKYGVSKDAADDLACGRPSRRAQGRARCTGRRWWRHTYEKSLWGMLFAVETRGQYFIPERPFMGLIFCPSMRGQSQ